MEFAAVRTQSRRSLGTAVSLLLLLGLLAVPASAGSLQVTTVSPANGQTVSGTVAWTVTVSPNNVDHVDFAVDGTVRATATQSPWTFSLDTTGLANGSHRLTATAYANGNGNGGNASSSVTVSVANGLAGPSIQSAPTVSGSAVVGQVLNASTGTWAGATPMTYAYAWSRCDSSGASCTSISGATSSSYTIASADGGSTLRVSVTATNSVASAIASSAPTAPVSSPSPSAPTAPANTGLPTISGSTVVGQTLKATTGSWSGTTPMTYSFSWSRCGTTGSGCSAIAGAGSSSYTLVSGDAGSTFRVSVTATNSASSTSATSAATAVVSTATPTTTGSSTLGTSLPARMPSSTGSQTLIVSPSGNGTSCTLSSPCALSQAWSVASSGTIIQLRGGNYGLLDVEHRRFSATNPVTMTSYPGETATFVGSASSPSLNATAFVDCQGIRISKVTFAAPYNVANLKINTSQHIEIDHVVSRNAGSSAYAGGNGILVVSESGYSQPYSDDVQIWNSTIYNWSVGATSDLVGKHGIYYGAHGANHGVIANNVIYDGPTGFGLQLGGDASNTIVTNNTIVHMYQSTNGVGSAMVIWNDGYNLGTNNNIVVNNIFTNDVEYAIEGCGSASTGNVVRNNLSYANALGDYASKYGSNTIFSVQSALTGNPLFVNPAGHDYHLQAGSPALGKADPGYTPPYDADGNARPANPALGAFG